MSGFVRGREGRNVVVFFVSRGLLEKQGYQCTSRCDGELVSALLVLLSLNVRWLFRIRDDKLERP